MQADTDTCRGPRKAALRGTAVVVHMVGSRKEEGVHNQEEGTQVPADRKLVGVLLGCSGPQAAVGE